jgi:hypothetical protein
MLDRLIELFFGKERIVCLLKQQYRAYLFLLYDIYENQNNKNEAKSLFITSCIKYPELIFEEFEERQSKMYLFRRSKIYQLRKYLIKPFLILRKIINHR